MEGSLVAYKVFTNGSVLNASEINDNLMNQSVMVFSNSTARAAALTAPVEGMLTWLQDTNKYEYRNGSGAWVELVPASTPSGLALINTTSFSGVASQSVNNVFSATYDNYKILVDFTDSTADCEVTMRLRVAGVDASSAVYSNRYLHGAAAVSNDSQTSFRFIMELDGGSDGHYYSNSLDVKSPFKAEQTIISLSGLLRSSLAAPYLEVGSAIHDANTSYDGFTLLTSTGTMTGVVSVYGYSK
jgi:hypothetical protein